MDSPQHGFGSDEDFTFLDFGDQSGPDSGPVADFGDGFGQNQGAVLDFGDQSGRDEAGQPPIGALVTDEPAALAHTRTESELIEALPKDAGDLGTAEAADDETDGPTATVMNPPETVSVTATMDGRISRVELSADAVRMTESTLAEEIFVIADLARQRALSLQHSFVLECFHELGLEDEGFIGEALQNGVTGLRSPQQAAEAQAEVFATRYVDDDR